eukprot:1191296-Prorocentrum_minimum.AAC.1
MRRRVSGKLDALRFRHRSEPEKVCKAVVFAQPPAGVLASFCGCEAADSLSRRLEERSSAQHGTFPWVEGWTPTPTGRASVRSSWTKDAVPTRSRSATTWNTREAVLKTYTSVRLSCDEREETPPRRKPGIFGTLSAPKSTETGVLGSTYPTVP